ncbi:hypothetical protein GCE86_19280 [Micromonospora terminaliae]|uniref:Uncharacterized protein n=1 Tax=Micromonospora terminaliae TaxID=1914461 RepID=A0AAJ2ZFZ4_9ACTN|nr:hypothetical protein [Micromonospora terminaliae]NES29025.1 hypothetical protein [Micromonospora terminaliae]QGL48966.1 hypothetical protein GCE86_19280 [Micromonospora terminaliae]
MRKTAVSATLLAAVFLILLSGNVTEASLSFVKLKNLAPITAGLPVVISYLAYSYMAQLADVTHLVYLHDQIIRIKYPDMYENDIEMFLAPPSSVLHRTFRLRVLLPGAVGQSYAWLAYFIPALSLLSGPAVLLFYSFRKIIRLEGLPRPLLIASVALTAVFALFAALELWLPITSRKRGWRPWGGLSRPGARIGPDSTEEKAGPPVRQGNSSARPLNSKSDA